jgi:hypothetical protein
MVALGTSSGTGVWWEGPTGDSSFVINWFIPLTQDVQTVVW